jgi:hypothetical protein
VAERVECSADLQRKDQRLVQNSRPQRTKRRDRHIQGHPKGIVQDKRACGKKDIFQAYGTRHLTFDRSLVRINMANNYTKEQPNAEIAEDKEDVYHPEYLD